MKTGIELIAEERARQIEKEGWTTEHDATHTNAELAEAGAVYAEYAVIQTLNGDPSLYKEEVLSGLSESILEWPWDNACFKPSKDPIRNLTKAAALLAAEIDRILKRRAKNL